MTPTTGVSAELSTTSVLFVAALVVGVAFPSIGLLALLLLTLGWLVEPMIYRLVTRST